MTYASSLASVSRIPVSYVVITLDYCSLTFGVGACTATASDKCYNTYPTCRDKANFDLTTTEYRFTSANAPLPFKNGERPYIKSITYLPTEIKDSLTVSSRIQIEFYDEDDTDIGIDPYLSDRTSVQGTFWKKLLARNTNWKGRIVKHYEGFSDLAEEFFTQKFVGAIDNITLKKGVVRIDVVDLLQSLDDTNIPEELDLCLATDITAVATSITLDGTDVASLDASAGFIRVDDEIIYYGSRNVDTKILSSVLRGRFGTTAATHDEDTSVQEVRYFAPASGFDHLQTILTYCGIDAGYVDSAGIDAERDLDIGDDEVDLSAIISKPTSAKTLFFELVDLLNCKAWVGEDLKITVKRNFPNYPSRAYTTFTDDANIIQGSTQVDLNKKSRISRVSIYWDRIAEGEDDNIDDYNRLDMGVDAEAESVNEYNEIAPKVIYCRWLRFGYDTEEAMKSFVKTQALRLVGQSRDPMPIISFWVELKDSDIKTGSFVKLTTDELQDKDGNDLTSAVFQVIRRQQKKNHIELDLLRITPKKYLIIAPAAYDAKDYDTATETEREYGAISEADTDMANGDPGYRIY